jgi:hypothetical protein
MEIFNNLKITKLIKIINLLKKKSSKSNRKIYYLFYKNFIINNIGIQKFLKSNKFSLKN